MIIVKECLVSENIMMFCHTYLQTIEQNVNFLHLSKSLNDSDFVQYFEHHNNFWE